MRGLVCTTALAVMLSLGAMPSMGDAATDGGIPPATLDHIVPCTELPAPDVVPGPDLHCPAAIRPGAASNSCTLNFVVTDGDRHYIGAAGHCAGVGKRLSVAGVPGTVGTAIVSRNNGLSGDWAFFIIDEEDEQHIDPTLCRFGGPIAGALGASRVPVPGEPALHYGHGASLGQDERTKGRIGAPVIPLPVVTTSFAFASSVDSGDSGSPVRAATGEAIGIVWGSTGPGVLPSAVIASTFEDALADLEATIGRDAWVVEGRPVPDWVQNALPV